MAREVGARQDVRHALESEKWVRLKSLIYYSFRTNESDNSDKLNLKVRPGDLRDFHSVLDEYSAAGRRGGATASSCSRRATAIAKVRAKLGGKTGPGIP